MQSSKPNDYTVSGWWYTYPSEKYESQLGSLFPIIIWKNQKCSKPPTRCFCCLLSFYLDTSCSSAESGDECFCHIWKLVASIPRVRFKDTLVSLMITSPFLSFKTAIQTHKFPCKSILLNTQAKNSSVLFLYLAEFLS